MVLNSRGVLARVQGSVQQTATAAGRKVMFRAMGTTCQIVFNAPSPAAGDYFVQEAVRWVADFEAKYSRFLPDSLISRINQRAGRECAAVDPETQQLFALCQELSFMTGGAFDATALPFIKLWDWQANPPTIPDAAAIRAARELVGWSKVQCRPGAVFLPRAGMSLDLGGIGKEYAVDRVVHLALEHGLKSALVDFGQDIRVFGTPLDKPAWHIGLQDPQDPARCWTGVAARDVAVATSGDYLRKCEINGQRYGHIIDPRTGSPVANGCRAVSVIAPTCTIAGALSTTAFVLGPQEGLRLIEGYLGAEGCVLTDTKRYETRRFHEYLTH
ncbi:MAG: FAD:protein FMN transferase [Verrucomicrobia bacterium]|nr:FAD:protein FMN transferase [Verrucomicrobiota bacterium]